MSDALPAAAIGHHLRSVAAMTVVDPAGTTAAPTFRCGHPKSDANTYWGTGRNGTRYSRCRECDRARVRSKYEPRLCGSCGEPLGTGGNFVGYHPGRCEPTTCTCLDGGRPDGLGECATCRRLVLTHASNNGRRP